MALGEAVTLAIGAGMGLKLEAVFICLHDVDAGALRHLASGHLVRRKLLWLLWIALVGHGDGVEASDAATFISS